MVEAIGNSIFDKKTDIKSTADILTDTVEKQIENATNMIRVNARLQTLMQNLRLALFATQFIQGEEDTMQGSFSDAIYQDSGLLGRNMDQYL